MLVVMNSHATEKDIKRVELFIESKGFEARVSHGEARTVVHAIGVKEVDQRDFELLHGVDEVIKLSTNYNFFVSIRFIQIIKSSLPYVFPMYYILLYSNKHLATI